MALRLRTLGRGGEYATLIARRSTQLAILLVLVGLALIVFASDSLVAVIAGILAITVAALLAMRS